MCDWNIRVLVNDIVLALVINTSATLLAGAPMAWGTWYPYTCVAFTTNVVALIFVTIISLTEAVTQVGPAQMLAAWSQTYLQLVLIGYVTSVVLFKIPSKH